MYNNTSLIKMAILMVALVQMGTNGIAPALSGISESFPGVSASVVQYLMTFPSLMVVVISPLAAGFSSRIGKKNVAAIGCLLIVLGGTLGFLCYSSLPALFLFAVIIGIGIGMSLPMGFSLVDDFFVDKEKANMMGLCTSFGNLGSMIMTLIGGFLAAMAWHLNYLVYFIAIPGMVLPLLFIPNKQKQKKAQVNKNLTSNEGENDKPLQEGEAVQAVKEESTFIGVSFLGNRISKNTLFICGLGLFFMFLFNAGPTNLSMFVSETGLGDATVAGAASACLLFGGFAMGFFFEKVHSYLNDFILSLGAVVMALGLIMVAGSHTVALLFIGCFIIGCSMSCFMPKCMLITTDGCNEAQATLATAITLAAINLGCFLTPSLTIVASIITGSEAVAPRFYLGVFVAAVLFVVVTVRAFIRLKNK